MGTDAETKVRSADPTSDSAKAALVDHRKIKKILGEIADVSDLQSLIVLLTEAADLLPKHFAEEEGPDGIFEQLSRERPALSHQLDVLVSQHKEILERLDGLLASARKLRSAEMELDVGISEALNQLREHEAQETSLIMDCYWLDDGEI